ncbi:MAG: hypothetical protein A3E78_04040 [Alphaproteobacteria bacterium RIFCSPHIGHO2_12_FULL_63_12]|nr:MAG: hypothetical protein A3E78_04040 [Alphaproteobacteria bacterium RIFCSPHIGHO2_12_FULL_63_12]
MSYEPLPWLPWYWRDWRANRKVQRMTPAERGIYRELLDECWVEGSLPPDLPGLAEVARCSLDDITAAWPALEHCFAPRPGDGRLVNDKIVKVLMAQREAHERRVHAGRRGGLASGETRRERSNAPATTKQCSTTVEQQSRTETALHSGAAGPGGPPPRPNSPKRRAAGLEVPAYQPPPDPFANIIPEPPTPEQLAELAAVRAALRPTAKAAGEATT